MELPRRKRLNKLLGVDIKKSFISMSLNNLGLKIEAKKDMFRVIVDDTRKDLAREIDLIEEIARLYGYDKIPSKIPKALIADDVPNTGSSRKAVGLVKDILVSLGFNEVMNYSLVSSQLLDKLGLKDEETLVTISNPLSIEQAVMRPTLIGGIINTALFNLNHRESLINIFEIGNVYRKQKNAYKEELHIAGALGGIKDVGWSQRSRKVELYDLKGALEEFFRMLGITN